MFEIGKAFLGEGTATACRTGRLKLEPWLAVTTTSRICELIYESPLILHAQGLNHQFSNELIEMNRIGEFGSFGEQRVAQEQVGILA